MIQETLTSDLNSAGRLGAPHRPSTQQIHWLERGLSQPGGKLPLFDEWGQRVSERTVKSCIDQGWAEPWFTNPLKPDWLVCKLTAAGRAAVAKQ
jgi:hypothetical protein